MDNTSSTALARYTPPLPPLRLPSADKPGVRFGRWTVLDEMQYTPSGERKWLCQCDCGTRRFVLERGLKSGSSRSCGCLRRENLTKAIAHDLTGRTFGQLTVLHRADRKSKSGGVWWQCRCSCGELYEVPGTLLVTGQRTRCPSKVHEKNYAYTDITGRRFHRLVALYPTQQRDAHGSVVWHCRCDCGNEVDFAYNMLVHCSVMSCGCRKKEHDQKLHQYLTHVDGTSLDMIRSRKLPRDNTTGCKGVYLLRGKYAAKIVFQKKAYYLGSFDRLEDAAAARHDAEQLLFEGTADFYKKWQQRAEQDPEWAAQNPVQIKVQKGAGGTLDVTFLPEL